MSREAGRAPGVTLLRALLGLGYPLVVFAGLRFADARTLALSLAAILLARVALGWRRPARADLGRLLPLGLAVGLVLGAAALLNDPRSLLFVPAALNAALLVAFARTLGGGRPTMIETFARLQDPELSPAQLLHCRRVTAVWCGFFLLNGAVSLGLALRGEVGPWALYTGVIAYLLMGVLFAAEFLVRAWRFDGYRGTLVEPVFRRLLGRSGRRETG